jgi:hypothetical protein
VGFLGGGTVLLGESYSMEMWPRSGQEVAQLFHLRPVHRFEPMFFFFRYISIARNDGNSQSKEHVRFPLFRLPFPLAAVNPP